MIHRFPDISTDPVDSLALGGEQGMARGMAAPPPWPPEIGAAPSPEAREPGAAETTRCPGPL